MGVQVSYALTAYPFQLLPLMCLTRVRVEGLEGQQSLSLKNVLVCLLWLPLLVIRVLGSWESPPTRILLIELDISLLSLGKEV